MRDTMDKRLRADGSAFRAEPCVGASVRDEPVGRHRAARNWLAPAAAAAAAASIAAGSAFLTGSDHAAGRASGAQTIANPYPAPAPAVGREVTINVPDQPGSARNETARATVITEDPSDSQSLIVYRRAGEICVKWQAPQSSSVACRPPRDEVTFQGAGPVIDAAGPHGSAAAWGSVPASATTVIIEAADGTNQRLQVVDGAPYGANFYLSAFDVTAHPVAAVTAYNADGQIVQTWQAPRGSR